MGHISKELNDFLYSPFPQIPVFYVLPKIHKDICPLPGWLIVSGCDRLLESLAQFLDSFLQPFCVFYALHY